MGVENLFLHALKLQQMYLLKDIVRTERTLDKDNDGKWKVVKKWNCKICNAPEVIYF